MLAHALRKEPFFQALSPDVVASIRNYLYHREYEPRQIVVGSTRETITIVLHKLREDGIISIANRRVTAPDPVALEHAARSG